MSDARFVGLVAVGGAVGTLMRHGAGQAMLVATGTFPATTLMINVVGAFTLGLLLGALARHRPDDTTWRPLVGVGVLGAFTTFSTFSVETVQLVRADRVAGAAFYVVASIVAGVLAARVGERLAGATPALIPEDEA